MIFCPACESRALPINKNNENTRYRCTKIRCSKEFKPRK